MEPDEPDRRMAEVERVCDRGFTAGRARTGTTFRWKAGAGTIVWSLRRVERPHSITWTGRSLGVRGIRVWNLRAERDATVVTTRESWDGRSFVCSGGRCRRRLRRPCRTGPSTCVWDVRDLDSPVLANTFENETSSIDHNIYTEGNASYHSNYTSGLRVHDNRNLPNLTEERFFDEYPENDDATFDGTWSNYPYFSQNNRIVAVSSMDRGLFILRVRG